MGQSLKGEDGDGPEQEESATNDVEQRLGHTALERLLDVVVDDGAQTVTTVEKPQHQEPPVKELPPRIFPSLGDKTHRGVGDVVLDVHDVHVDQRQEEEDDPGDPHEEPCPCLKVLA